MSFTQDELQSLNTIFDQKMAVLRRELEHSLDQRIHAVRREFEQRLVIVLQDLLRTFSRRLSTLQQKSRDSLSQRLDQQHAQIIHTLSPETYQQSLQQQLEEVVDRALAAQLLAIEQLIHQRISMSPPELPVAYTSDGEPDFDAIEVQTEIPWEDLVELIDKALDTRFASLSTSLHAHFHTMEQSLLQQIQATCPRATHEPSLPHEPTTSSITTIQDIFTGIEQLERLVESMQVAMTANTALISNRLYHHQHLPLERAHPSQKPLPPLQPQDPLPASENE